LKLFSEYSLSPLQTDTSLNGSHLLDDLDVSRVSGAPTPKSHNQPQQPLFSPSSSSTQWRMHQQGQQGQQSGSSQGHQSLSQSQLLSPAALQLHEEDQFPSFDDQPDSPVGRCLPSKFQHLSE
jgi:hypothetical protein